MNAAPDATYRCINPACARAMPRPVAFCPYCGTPQQAQAAAPRDAPAAAIVGRAEAAAASASASVGGWGAAPQGGTAVPPAADGRPGPAAGAPPAWSAPPDTRFGHSAGAGQAPAAHGRTRPGPEHAWGRGPSGPAAPAQPAPQGRRPVQLRWWVLFLLILWGVWLWAKPDARKIDQRIDRAVALARACKAREAQDELIALRSLHASAEQLERVQQSLNEEAAACTRRQQRDKAWRETSDAVEAALSAPNAAILDRARGRLQAFTRRWGEDERTRTLRDRIDEARHPLAVPPASGAGAM